MTAKTSLKKATLALGVALAFTAGTASAIPPPPNGDPGNPYALIANGAATTANVAKGSFTDFFTFSLTETSSVTGWAMSAWVVGPGGFTPTTTFSDVLLFEDTDKSHTYTAGDTQIWELKPNAPGFTLTGILGKPDYIVEVNGNASTQSFYVAGLNTAPVPEPGEWIMILAGLGLVGAMARRRSL